jgi:hypothetical protein
MIHDTLGRFLPHDNPEVTLSRKLSALPPIAPPA